MGAPLTANEFLKIEQTHLADIIAGEKGNEHYRVHDAHVMSPSTSGVQVWKPCRSCEINQCAYSILKGKDTP